MKEEETISNREYLAFILAGGAGDDPFRLIECAVNEAGQVVFSRVVEQFGLCGEGYDIQISGPGGKFEIWMGEGREYVAIRFPNARAGNDAPEPAIPLTPAEVLESLERWKAGPGVREAITNKCGAIVREYCPAPDVKLPPAPGQ